MRVLPCPNCTQPIKFSWADFVFLNNWGKSNLFCLSCKKSCTISNRTTQISFAICFLPFLVLLYLFFVSGLFSPPKWAGAVFVICSMPLMMLGRAYATEKYAELSKS